jgi:hypothetical protein
MVMVAMYRYVVCSSVAGIISSEISSVVAVVPRIIPEPRVVPVPWRVNP